MAINTGSGRKPSAGLEWLQQVADCACQRGSGGSTRAARHPPPSSPQQGAGQAPHRASPAPPRPAAPPAPATDQNAPVVMTLMFVVNKHISLLQDDFKLRYEIDGPGVSLRGGPVVTNASGMYKAENVPLTPRGAGRGPTLVSVFIDQEDLASVQGSCNVAPNDGKYLYIFIDPVVREVVVTEKETHGRQTIGGGMTTKDGGSVTAGGRLAGVGIDGTVSTETSRSIDTTNTTGERSTEVRTVRQTVTGLECKALDTLPSQVSERAAGGTATV